MTVATERKAVGNCGFADIPASPNLSLRMFVSDAHSLSRTENTFEQLPTDCVAPKQSAIKLTQDRMTFHEFS